jgi:heat shock transcription factor
MMPAQQQQQPQQQRMPQSYVTSTAGGDQIVKWNGGVDNYGGLMDGDVNGGNGYDLIQNQPQYSQNGAAPSNSLTRRPMNQALVSTHALSNFDGSMPWNDLNEDTSLISHGQDGSTTGQDNVELLEEMAQKAKRDAQGKRKQIPPFVQKLSSFLEEGKNEDLIRWSEKGDSFIVLDEDEFAKTLIPELFKHRNYASFVRQLNMYGFHKRVGLSDNSMRASERKNKIPSEYSNPYFRRGHPNLLWLISKPKSGTKGKKNSKNNDGEVESDEDAGLEDASGQVPGSSSAQAPKSLPSTENQAVAKKEMNLIREELVQVREQQKIIGGTIRRLQQSNHDLYNKAMLFQNQHDRHQNSINAILNFLANLFRKSLEEQGNAQSVSDIISSMIASQGQGGAHPGNVVDLGDFFQTSVDGSPSLGGPPAKRARGLLPPIPAQNTGARSTRSPSSGRGSYGPPTSHSNQEMGHITELTDVSPSETPNIRQELETNPQEQMMRIINDHNATNTSGMDLPEAAEFVASAPNLNQDQRNKLANFMARQSNSPSSTGPSFASPSSSRQPAAYNQQAHTQPRPAQPAQSTPYTGDPSAAAPSLSPILRSPAMDPLSMHQINSNQNELDQLHHLQNQQDQKLSELQSMLGPLSPSGRIPEIDETGGEQYFDPNNVDFDQFFDFNNIDDATFGGVPNDFNIDFSSAGQNNTGLDPGLAGVNGGHSNGSGNTPSPSGTEEITRDELGIGGGLDGGNKRRRVS